MCVSGTGRIQLPQPLFTWFLLYFMLSKRDFRVIKLFPSCPESPSLYSMLSSCMHSHVTTALPAFCAYLPGFSRNSLFSATRCVFWREFPIWDTHFLLDWVLIKQLQISGVSVFPLHGVPSWDVSSLASCTEGRNSSLEVTHYAVTR